MGFLSRKLRQRDHPSNPKEWLLNWFGGGKTASGATVNNYTALNYTALWACVRVICKAVSTMPLHLYERLPEGGKQRAVKHPLYHLLHTRPNNEMVPLTFKDTLTAHVLTWGNGYAEIERNKNRYPIALWPLTPNRVTPERDKKSREIRYRITLPDGGTATLSADQVFHIPGPGFDGTKGYSVLTMFREAVGLGMSLQEYSARFFGNGAAPMGVLEHPDALKEPAKNYLRDSWNEMHQGLSNAHRVAILEEGMKYHQIGISPEDAQMLESRKFSQLEMASIFQIPPHKMGNLDRATFCLPADAKVFTKYGPVNIAEVSPGNEVWSLDESGNWILAPVVRSDCTGEDEILTIKTGIRKLHCNAKHRVLVQRRELEPYTGGRGQTVTVDGQKYRHTWRNHWVSAGEIAVGDFIVVASDIPDVDGGSSCLTRTVTNEFMEILGILSGDGFFFRNQNGTGSGFGISHGENDDYLPYYVNAIEREFRRYDGPYGRKNGGTKQLQAVRRDKNTTIFYSGLAYDELDACGIIGTSKTKRIPGWVFGLRREYKLSFLRGYLDSDGTVNKNGYIRYVSVNRELLDDVRHLCISAGIRVGNIFTTKIKSHFKGYGDYEHLLHAFICTNAKDNMSIGSHTKMYQDRMQANLKRANGRRNTPVYPNEEKMYGAGNGVIRSAVLSIERSDIAEPVFDLEVAGTHCFVADGVVVHNSNVEHQAQEFLTDTLLYWLTLWEQTVQWKLLTPSDQVRYFAEFLTANLLRGDLKSRYDAYAVGKQWGWLSSDDIRDKENENPLPDGQGQTYWMPLNMRPVNQSGHSTSGDPPKKDIGGENNEA